MSLSLVDGSQFSIIDVPGDGNCLFYSLSQCLFSTIASASEIRANIVEYVCQHWDSLQCMTSKSDGSPFESMVLYSSTMGQAGAYGDAAEIAAASKIFDSFIRVVEGQRFVGQFNEEGSRQIFLLYDRNRQHYSALRRLDPLTPPSSPSSFHDDIDNPDGPAGSDASDVHVNIRIGSSLRRPCSIKPLPCLVTGRHSLELPCGVIGAYYLWAWMFQTEDSDDISLISLGDFNAKCPNDGCGAMFWQAEHLANIRCNELPFWCCGKSTRTVLSERGLFRPIRDEYIRSLYYEQSADGIHFRQNIRSYNAVLSTAMPVVNYEKTLKCKQTVTVNGKVTFKAPSCPNFGSDGLPAHHGQLFFLDVTRDTIQKRLTSSTNSQIREDVLAALEAYLRQHNDLVRTFEYAGKVQRSLEEEGGQDDAVNVAVVLNPHRDGFRVTDRELFVEDSAALRPEGSECVAAVFLGSEVRYHYDMVFHPRERSENDPKFMEIREASPTLDIMLYPLIHLHAEDPWVNVVVPDNRQRRRKRPCEQSTEIGTLRQYYSSRIMVREQVDSGVLFRCRGLYQQWLLDSALKIMDSNMRYSESHQDELQVCRYNSLQRYVQSVAERHQKHPGRIVILPQYEQKSERSMYSSYMDSVRIAMEFTPPSFFITFTVNPRWPEIVDQLAKRGLQPQDYMHAPDIVVRVFLARLNVFMSDIIHKSVLGRVQAYIGVTEFTSTMLPHYHLSIMLHPVDRPESPDMVDAIVSAEIPDANLDPIGHKLVMGLMLHRPCDGSSPNYTNMPCRPGGPGTPCKHGFPKAFRNFTDHCPRGYRLRRRKTPQIWHRKFQCMVDNSWVVEFNVKLLKRHTNHINVRRCADNIWFKYLFSYMQKESKGQHVQGSMLKFSLAQAGDVLNWDEIEAFRTMRLLGPYEAVYRILGRSFVEMSHSVQSLPIHLPDEQLVYYRDLTRAASLSQNSKLLAYFKLNEQSAFARTLLYQDIVKYFKWSSGSWVEKRSGASCLGRLMHVNPSLRNLELFHLRLLLLQVRGATSFTDLLTVADTTYITFQEACNALGIAADSYYSYGDALEDVAKHASPWQMRNFFVCLIVHCRLDSVTEHWIKHRSSMAEDYQRHGRPHVLLLARREVLRLAAELEPTSVEMIGRHLTVPGDSSDSEEIIPEETSILDLDVGDINPASGEPDRVADVQAHLSTLNAEQRAVHDYVLESVLHGSRDRSNIISLMAPAGCGKTHVYIGIINDCKSRGIPYVAAAFTAIAALLLPEGETCHRLFGIPIRGRTDGTERSFIEAQSEDGLRLAAAQLILIDECSMISLWQVILIDHLFRMLTGNRELPFGGKTVLFGGDMAQILPVLKGGSVGDVTNHCILAWQHWNERHALTLTTNMRASTDPSYAKWVGCVRDGSANVSTTSDNIIVPEYLLVKPIHEQPLTSYKTNKDGNTRDEDGLISGTIQRVFGDMSEKRVEEGVILCPTNRVVRDINSKVLRKMPGQESIFYAKTTICLQDADNESDFLLTTEELNAIQASNLPPHELKLKIGCAVMLLTNLNKKQGLCNGTRFTVTGMTQHSVTVKRLVPFQGRRDEVILPRMRLKSDDIPVAGTVNRFQFPVCLAFAITINKSQGQSIENVGIFLRQPVFTLGQFYVAVSRGKRGDRVCIAVLKGPVQGPMNCRVGRVKPNTTKTKNIVLRGLM